MPSLQKWNWKGCWRLDPAYTIQPNSGYTLAVTKTLLNWIWHVYWDGISIDLSSLISKRWCIQHKQAVECVIVVCKLTSPMTHCYQNEIQKNNVKLREHFKTDISSILKVRFGFSLLFLSLLPPVQLNLFWESWFFVAFLNRQLCIYFSNIINTSAVTVLLVISMLCLLC